MEEKISVIIPIYKVEKYLEKCVKSVLNQTYKNLEVILVDDGSPDNCGKICDMFAERDKRIFVIHKENGGISDARNVGLRKATGEYIAFVDSDDYIEPDMYEELLQHIKKDRSELAICNFWYVDEMGTSIDERNNDLPIRDEVISGDEALARLAEKKYWYYVTAWNKLYQKQLLEGIEFPKGKIREDEFVAHHVLYKCKRISCVKKPLYQYVQRKHSIMNSSFTAESLDVVDSFCNRVVFTCDKNTTIAEISLQNAANHLLKGYRELDRKKENLDILREKRKLYNKAYIKAFKTNISFKTRIKCGVVFMHPKLYILLAKIF